MTNGAVDNSKNEKPLDSWKEIAAYLQRDVSTAMRWEKYEGLPVRRHHHLTRSSVYAYPSELDAWRANRKPTTEMVPLWHRPLPSVAFALVLLLAMATVGSGPHIGTMVQAADGSEIFLRQVWTGPDADADGTPSPDGRYLSFTDWSTGDLAVRDLTTEQNRRLTNKEGGWENWHEYVESSVISPDGKRVAFGWYDKQDHCELRVVGLDGSEPRVLYRTENQGGVIEPEDWSKDGKHILALLQPRGTRPGTSKIVLVSSADGSVRVLKTLDWRHPMEMRLSPDGRFVVYDFPVDEAGGNHDISVFAVDGGKETPLVRHPANDFVLGWAPDGNSILFASERTGSWGSLLIRVDNGEPRGQPTVIKSNMGWTHPMGFSPMGFTRDGAFYYGVTDRGENVYIAKMDLKAGKTIELPSMLVQRFIGRNSAPQWSADGKYLAYVSRRGPPPKTTTLCVQSMDTGKVREFSPDFVWLKGLQWSRDGRSIMFRGLSLQGQKGSFLIDSDSGEVTSVLPDGPGNWIISPQWSSDGRSIYYTRQEEGGQFSRIVMRSLDTGGEKEIFRSPKGKRIVHQVASPDGQRFVFRLFDVQSEKASLAVLRVSGGEVKELLGPNVPVPVVGYTWAADSQHILFVKAVLGSVKRFEIWSISAEGGEPRSVGLSVNKRIYSLSAHPDGQRLVFAASDPKTDVWVMENFLPVSEAAVK